MKIGLRLKKSDGDPRGWSVEVDGYEITFSDEGEGSPIVFLHGGILSAHAWRSVTPLLKDHARCVAVDLFGTGQSTLADDDSADGRPTAGRPSTDGANSWKEHLARFDAFIDALDLSTDVTLVMHGWASIVGLGWARDHEDRVRGLAYMEAITHPVDWTELPPSFRAALEYARSDDGQDYVMGSDGFFDDAIVAQTVTAMDSTVVEEHRARLGPVGEHRRALYQALLDIPVGGEPSDATSLVEGLEDWLESTTIPKLVILGEPGYLVTQSGREKAQAVADSVARVSGAHLLPEESPQLVGMFLRLWHEQLS